MVPAPTTAIVFIIPKNKKLPGDYFDFLFKKIFQYAKGKKREKLSTGI